MSHIFPFGSPLRKVRQEDRRPKRVFVLGVYASAVHARWLDPDGRERVKALAVASEPEIFWRGDGTRTVLDSIKVPPGVGNLLPADPKFNGPSGRALDEHFLQPLGLSRDDVWLSDLVPHSCLNPGQRTAIKRAYMPLVESRDLPTPSIPPPPSVLATAERQEEIAEELVGSGAETLVLLGDQPIRWFLRRWQPSYSRLAQFGESRRSYGRPVALSVAGKNLQVLPLVHPRQSAKLGRHSAEWHSLHEHWRRTVAGGLLR